jgi:hypothetical protein
MSLSISQRDLITRALLANGTIAVNEVPDAATLETGSQLLAEVIDEWASQANALTVLTVNRQVYTLVSGQGGPDLPYTYGPGGDFDTGTAQRPPSIQDANLILNTSSPAVEIPMAIVTTDMYAAQPIKSLTNSLPVWLYYNDTVPLGQVFLWPIPTDAANQLALYVPIVTPAFADLTTLYVCPPGYQKTLRLCLQAAMVTPFAVNPAIAQKVITDADQALTALKVSNAASMMGDLTLDPAFTPNPWGRYVIQTDQNA